MKNIFKKIISTVLSTAVLMAGNVILSVSAVDEETTAQKYTVEDLLPMSKEEICELLGDRSAVYEDAYKYIGKYHLFHGGDISVTVAVYDSSKYLDLTSIDENSWLVALSDDLGLNTDMVDMNRGFDFNKGWSSGVYDAFTIGVNYTYYTEYDFRHVFACTMTSIELAQCTECFLHNFVTFSINYGDANSDGNINAMDATVVARYAVGAYTFTNRNAMLAADVNGDYEVNAMDATMIARYAVGEIESFE